MARYHSPLGALTLASDGSRLTGLWFDGQKHFAATLHKEHEQRQELPVFCCPHVERHPSLVLQVEGEVVLQCDGHFLIPLRSLVISLLHHCHRIVVCASHAGA